MRFLIIVIIVLLAIFYFLPEPEPVPVEEGFIGDQVKTLRKAEGFEDQYLKSTAEQKQRLEQQLEQSGDG